jgi:hypothetical protein
MCLVATLKITLKALYIVDDCGGNWVSGDHDKNVANVGDDEGSDNKLILAAIMVVILTIQRKGGVRT